MDTIALDRIAEELRKTKATFEHEKAEFAKSFENNPAYALEWKTGPMLLAQARYEIACQLIDFDVAGSTAARDDIVKWTSRVERRFDIMLRTESRSTSAMSNLNEDAKNQATLELYGRVVEAIKS